MQNFTTKPTESEAGQPLSPDAIEATMRARVRDLIETILQEELDAILGAAKSARVGETRRGYRHGARAHADDEPWADDHPDAASPDPGARSHDFGMAERDGPTVSAADRARR